MMQPGSLKQKLWQHHEADMIRRAELIRDWAEGEERTEEALIHVRLALHECPSRISEETRYRIYSILHFVMPGDSWAAEESTPDEVLDQQAAWEMQHQKQLEQRSCPECGDGVCPTS